MLLLVQQFVVVFLIELLLVEHSLNFKFADLFLLVTDRALLQIVVELVGFFSVHLQHVCVDQVVLQEIHVLGQRVWVVQTLNLGTEHGFQRLRIVGVHFCEVKLFLFL